MRLRLSQTGDTIVEVLIAMTVMAGVLGSSYTVVNRTMANARQAQEHTEALQIANKQVEYIATLAASGSAADLTDGNPRFNCADKQTGALVAQPALSDPAAFDKYVAACITDTPVRYMTAFEYASETNADGVVVKFFRVYITWPSVTGNGNDQVSLVYKAYQL